MSLLRGDVNMSEQVNSPALRYVTCRCQHCDGHIEFDANQLAEENSIFPCPHCGLETKLFVPPQVESPPATVTPPDKFPPPQSTHSPEQIAYLTSVGVPDADKL